LRVFLLARFIVRDATCRIAGVPPERRFFDAFDALFLLTQFCEFFDFRAKTVSSVDFGRPQCSSGHA
jgi:hypothetical protein